MDDSTKTKKEFNSTIILQSKNQIQTAKRVKILAPTPIPNPIAVLILHTK